jgi:hypothetical protein
VTSVLQRLFGQSGAASTPTSPTHEAGPPILSPSTNPPSSSVGDAPTLDAAVSSAIASSASLPSAPASGASVRTQDDIRIPTAIPSEYRERHRQREREREQEYHPSLALASSTAHTC